MMRHVICALATLLCGFALRAADLTVVLDFEAGHSARADQAMRSEAQRLLKGSGVSLDWRLLNQLSPGESFPRLAVVKLRGHCEMTAVPPAASDVPLGVTYRMDGEVIPFSEVRCDEVRSTLTAARLPFAPDVRDLLYGRALGRVLAHELTHVLQRSGGHAATGVSRKYLSAARLAADTID